MEDVSVFNIHAGKSHYSVAEMYRYALIPGMYHLIENRMVSVPPIERDQLRAIVRNKLQDLDIWEDNSTKLRLSLTQINEIIGVVCRLAVENSTSFCGYDVDKKIPFQRVSAEIQDLVVQILSISQTKESISIHRLEIPNSIVPVFLFADQYEISLSKVSRCILRGFEVARQCKVCEEVDPIIGGMLHIVSVILTQYMNTSAPLSLRWCMEMYHNREIYAEAGNPFTTGAFDVMIAIVHRNQDRFPYLSRFFNTNINNADGVSNYFDFVNYLSE